MTDLLDLIAEAEQQAAPEDHPLVAEFLRFHAQNAHIYRILVREVRRYREATGSTRCSVSCMWERLRWLLDVESSDDSPKLNDHHCAFFARLIMSREPDLRGTFEVRRSVADVDPSWIGRAR